MGWQRVEEKRIHKVNKAQLQWMLEMLVCLSPHLCVCFSVCVSVRLSVSLIVSVSVPAPSPPHTLSPFPPTFISLELIV